MIMVMMMMRSRQAHAAGRQFNKEWTDSDVYGSLFDCNRKEARQQATSDNKRR
jgi:hypothetical protein